MRTTTAAWNEVLTSFSVSFLPVQWAQISNGLFFDDKLGFLYRPLYIFCAVVFPENMSPHECMRAAKFVLLNRQDLGLTFSRTAITPSQSSYSLLGIYIKKLKIHGCAKI